MAFLKLATMRMAIANRCDLALYGYIVVRNVELVSKTIKKEANRFTESTFTQERQDLWAKLVSLELIGVAAKGLDTAVEQLINRSKLTKQEVAEWHMTVAKLYEDYDSSMHVPALVSLFEEGITAYYSKVREFLEGTEGETPPRLTVIPDAMKSRIKHLCEVTEQ